MDTVTVGSTELKTKALPKGFVLREEMGLITANAVDGQVVHRTQTRILETRATITPKGDFLLMFPEGDHYAKSKGEKINSMMASRSTDHGKTWSKPAVATTCSCCARGCTCPPAPHHQHRAHDHQRDTATPSSNTSLPAVGRRPIGRWQMNFSPAGARPRRQRPETPVGKVPSASALRTMRRLLLWLDGLELGQQEAEQIGILQPRVVIVVIDFVLDAHGLESLRETGAEVR